jgi:uncharacterized protein (TIGR02646 family)
MRRLRREPLSARALELLCERTLAVANAGNAHSTRGAVAKARRAKVDSLWNSKDNAAFREIRQKLKDMAPGNCRCMYCEGSEGTDIEHFWPKARYPWRAYTWENYLWACSACNSNHKREQFPRSGGRPLLINPTEEDPLDHLALSPSTGEYVGITDKGEKSIEVFGLHRYALVENRRDAWVSVQAQIVLYADACRRDRASQALDAQRTLCRHPHGSIFAVLLRVAETPAAEHFIMPACLEALTKHPEIKGWIE